MFEGTQLLPGLFIGSKPPTGPELALEGVDTLVLCAMEYQPRSREFPGLTSVIHVPLDDDELTSQEKEWALMAAMEAADRYQRGETVLITCMQGRNRSGLVAALTIAMARCTEPWRAAEHVTDVRRTPMGPALMNPSFMRFLFSLERFC